jgi:hypothetical protein
MNLKTVEEKLNIIKNGSRLNQKQLGYLDNFYDSIFDIENLIYHWSPNELLLLGGENTISDLEGIAGYDFSIESASTYIKDNFQAFMVVTDANDIQFFKEVVIDILNDDKIDENGDHIE